MRSRFLLVALATMKLLVIGGRLASAEPVTATARLVRGQKWLDPRPWRPVHDQEDFGLEVTLGQPSAQIGAAVDLFISRAKDDHAEGGATVQAVGETIEICLGMRRSYGSGWFRPYTGAGLMIARASLNLGTVDGPGATTDTALGYWFEGGLMVRLGRRVDLGMLLRYSRVHVQLAGAETDGGGLHMGAVIGVAFSVGE